MLTTRATLLKRVKDRSDDTAWRDFNRLYFPLLFRYARARGLSAADAEDVAQQAMQAVSTSIGEFDYSTARGKFRNWLRTIADRKVVDYLRKRRNTVRSSAALEVAESSSESPEALWDRQWEKEHLRYCLERLREELPAKSYQMFHLYALEQRPASEVAKLLDVTENLVWVTKSRVVERLQAMMAQLFEEPVFQRR